MISTSNPESMTAEDRRREVAGILAIGLLRSVHHAESSPQKTISKGCQNRLAVPAEKRLSVAQRPGG